MVQAKRIQQPERSSGPFVVASDDERVDVGPGIRRQLLGFGDSIMGARVWFEEGAVGEMHDHPHAQMAFVEAGSFDVTVGEETRRLSAGDSFYVAPHVRHGAVCIEKGILIDVFSPMREDFVDQGDA